MSNLHPTFQNIIDSFSHAQKVAIDLSTPQYPIFYRGYTIQPHPWPCFKFEYYPTDYDGETTHSAQSIREAKRDIDDIIFEKTVYKVQTKVSITKFTWIEDAVKFATQFNGVLLNPIDAI